MIETISIKNIVLIDSVSLDFNRHFTVLSGETGAGKSILIGAIGFLLGKKVSTDIIRTGSSEASVTGTFYIAKNHTKALAWLQNHDIELDNERITIRRTLKSTGRGTIWLQTAAISRAELEEFTSFLVDIHGQHEHQSLFNVAEHRRFLDSYAGILAEVQNVSLLYTQLAELKAQKAKHQLSNRERAEKIDYLSFVIDEIAKAQLQAGEDELLEAEESKLCQYEKLYEHLEFTESLLMQEHGIVPSLKKLQHLCGTMASIDESLAGYAERIDSAYYDLQDIGSFFSAYREKLIFDPERLAFVQERLAFIQKLKKKYGNSIAELLAYQQDAQAQLDSLEKNESDSEALDQRIAAVEAALFSAATEVSRKRISAAGELDQQVQPLLRQLGMQRAVFQVSVCPKAPDGNKQTIGMHGFDAVEFLIRANAGEPLRPLHKIASGGELSRVMLALKTVLAAGDETETLIFDEIDTGIGGEVACAVAEHIKYLAEKKQILCITHLAVIAAHADTHMKIEKTQSCDSSTTNVRIVIGESRIDEIARMLAGDEVSGASRIHAQELLSKYSSSVH